MKSWKCASIVAVAIAVVTLATPGRAVAAGLGVYVSVTVTVSRSPKSDGPPIPNLRVRLIAPNGYVITLKTNSAGKVVFANLGSKYAPNQYRVEVTYRGQTLSGRGHHIPIKFIVP